MCELLVAMNMESYIPKFQQEVVSGDLLLEVTDEILTEELGVTKEFHRVRLQKVISGEHSAEKLLDEAEADSYIKMVKR